MSDNAKKTPTPTQVTPTPTQVIKGAPQTAAPTPEILVWLKTYGLSAAIGVGIVLVVIVSATAYRNQQKKSNDVAFQQLMAAKNIQATEQVLTQFPSSPSAPHAILKLANERFDAGQYQESLAGYDQFLAKYKDHPGKTTAEMGRLMCMEASGRSAEALAGLVAFTNQYASQLHLIPQAVFAKARCLQAMGQLTEARAVYENFAVANTNNGWAAQAESSIALIDRKLREGVPAQKSAPVILQAPVGPQAPAAMRIDSAPVTPAAPAPAAAPAVPPKQASATPVAQPVQPAATPAR